MKRIILFFAVCLGLSVSQTTFANDADTVRAATKRTSVTTVSAQQTSSGRTVATSAKRTDNTQNSSKNTRTATQPQQKTTSRTTTKQVVKPRDNTTTTNQPTKRATTSRVASSRAVSSRQNESKQTTSARTATSAQRIKRISRATELNTEKITNIKSLNYSNCKTVYYDCMDEFCANKDSDLRRCACSSRIHEFDSIKKQLSDVEDKMLDFNQRLLTVSMDKEDAEAINVATEGEKAFATQDTSTSERILRTITDTLNNSGKSKIDSNLSPISLSLNIDTAWDPVNSTSGVATSAKSGLDLYNAATPICIEMAREVCTDDELDIAQNGYKLTIQQDCDTVAKSYKTQYNTAMEKIHESSALLDMSRLNVYQQHNSDNTLTCKKKILNQLYDASICGENLYKCLDMSGKYVDPSTGKAFLSEDLASLTSLLKEPANGERWSKVQQNESFVKFLDSKKKFLEPATEQCQDIADMVWEDFLDDALIQIKASQTAKLNEVKTNCTTLVAECKTSALKSLSDFDARALSTFSIAADKTANAMCEDIQKSCIALINSKIWTEGITGVAADESYNKIIETCTTIGRDCIVTQCNGTSGNFALCLKATDVNRRAILNREVCWNKVLECVKSADNLAFMNISDIYSNSNYYSGFTCPNDDTNACYIAKQIWGTCEHKADAYDIPKGKNSNKISMSDTSSLLSWFATNTGTANAIDSCNSKGCPINYAMINGTCQQIDTSTNKTSDCGEPTSLANIIYVASDITNYCASGVTDLYGNCCVAGAKDSGICVPDSGWQAARLWNLQCTSAGDYLCPTTGNLSLYCVTISTSDQPIVYYTDSNEYACGYNGKNKQNQDDFDGNAMWIIVDDNGNYYNANSKDYTPTAPNTTNTVNMSYNGSCSTETQKCTYKYNGNAWGWNGTDCATISGRPTSNNELLIEYNINTTQP